MRCLTAVLKPPRQAPVHRHFSLNSTPILSSSHSHRSLTQKLEIARAVEFNYYYWRRELSFPSHVQAIGTREPEVILTCGHVPSSIDTPSHCTRLSSAKLFWEIILKSSFPVSPPNTISPPRYKPSPAEHGRKASRRTVRVFAIGEAAKVRCEHQWQPLNRCGQQLCSKWRPHSSGMSHSLRPHTVLA